MNQSLQLARQKLDDFIASGSINIPLMQTEQIIKELMPFTQNQTDHTLYAWFPTYSMTPICPSELGTSSSMTCNNKDFEPENEDDNNNLPSPPSPSPSIQAQYQSNPF